ncbi:MAG TPA: ABC transporter ATP-binding protein [Myxococcaceae bacterium]|nr:ABC transporter ATP-binding protein [Myxococcaceae bacterium]
MWTERARSQLFRLFAYVKPHWPFALGAVLASCVAAGATAAYAYLVGPLLGAVLTGTRFEMFGIPLTEGDLRWKIPAAVVAVAGVKALAQFLHNGLMNVAGQRAMNDLRRSLYARLLLLPPSFFDARHSGDLLTRFSHDVEQVEFAITQALSSWAKDTLQVLALLTVCLMIDVRLFVLGFIVLPAAAIPVARFARSVKKVAQRTHASLGRLTELSSELLQNLPVVRAYRGEQQIRAAFDAEQRRYLSAMRRSLFIRGAFTPTLEVAGVVGIALCVGFGARAVAAEPALAGKLVTFLAAALLMYQPLKAISGTFAQVMQGVAALGRLFEITDHPAPPEKGIDAGPLRSSLELHGVRFSYDGHREALAGVDLRIPAGRRVAIVGPSGAGKTTLFSLLLGFDAPQAGEIRWDGVPLTRLRPTSVRARLGWVPQEPVLFSGSVRENLRVGNPDATEQQMWEALRRAHAEGFVRARSRGLDEEVGERGARLSGGERQRLAIARAFLRSPSLLLLDEPTSALDAASEREVQAGLAELMSDRTTVVIAHRLATVRDADIIYVLEAGRVVEQGAHDELRARGGRYAELLRGGALAA